ncbi:hypothetical protein BDV97DRAFT_354726 [Delphinella strobiligena]|nr:hypothetical protein BDV97DRAFT_354726 [Delphinella strobiligena]
MTRTLPWLKNGANSAAKSSPRPSSPRKPPPKRRRVTTPPGSDDDLDLNTTGISTPSRRRLLRGTRTPSTSPPPAPPVQMPMREGWAEDDIWMMVEDEFYSTAQSYTQHLHHAEYKRLKEIAKNREHEIKTRPTDNGRSTMSVDGKMALKVAAQEKNVKTALKNMGADPNKEDEDTDKDDPWIGTQLAGLMDSPRKATRLRASRLGAGRSETKAAKGFQRSSQTDITSQVTLARKDGSDDEEPRAMSPTRARSNWRREREIRRQSMSFEDKTEDEDEQDDDHDHDDLDDDDLDAYVRSEPRSAEKARLEPARAVATALSPTQPIGNRTHAKSPRKEISLAPRSSLRKSRNHDSTGFIASSKTSPCSSGDPNHGLVPVITNSAEMAASNQGMSIFARRRAERERAKREKDAEEAKKQQGRRDSIEIPTFMV